MNIFCYYGNGWEKGRQVVKHFGSSKVKILYEVVDLDWKVLLPKLNKQPGWLVEFCIDINSKKD